MDEPLDRDKVRELLDMTGGDAAWVRDLLQIYLDDTANRLAELHQLVDSGGQAASGTLDPIQRAAHGIKGSSSNIGAHRMAALCHRTEVAARDGDLVTVRALAAALDAELLRIRADVPLVTAQG